MRESATTVARKGLSKGRHPSVAEMQARIDALEAELTEAREQQKATAEVLQVINSTPGDLAPVFDAILERANRLCGASFGSLGIFDGETWRAVVQRGYGEPLASNLRQPDRGSDNPLLQQLIDGAPLVHAADLARLDVPIARANVAAGIRTLLVVALSLILRTPSGARVCRHPFPCYYARPGTSLTYKCDIPHTSTAPPVA